MTLKTMITAAVAATVMTGAAFAESHAGTDNPMVGGAAMFPDKTIVENALNSADHTTLVAAVKAAGLVDTLMSEGPFTVFAPTNAAFDMISDESLNALLQPSAKAQLTQILT